jgi:hypothetical protein
VAYSPATKITTLSIEKVGTTQVTGLPAMKSVWGVWLGSSDSAQEKRDLSSKL